MDVDDIPLMVLTALCELCLEGFSLEINERREGSEARFSSKLGALRAI